MGMSETYLKDTRIDIFSIESFNIEYTNDIGRERAGVCMVIVEELSTN